MAALLVAVWLLPDSARSGPDNLPSATPQGLFDKVRTLLSKGEVDKAQPLLENLWKKHSEAKLEWSPPKGDGAAPPQSGLVGPYVGIALARVHAVAGHNDAAIGLLNEVRRRWPQAEPPCWFTDIGDGSFTTCRVAAEALLQEIELYTPCSREVCRRCLHAGDEDSFADCNYRLKPLHDPVRLARLLRELVERYPGDPIPDECAGSYVSAAGFCAVGLWRTRPPPLPVWEDMARTLLSAPPSNSVQEGWPEHLENRLQSLKKPLGWKLRYLEKLSGRLRDIIWLSERDQRARSAAIEVLEVAESLAGNSRSTGASGRSRTYDRRIRELLLALPDSVPEDLRTNLRAWYHQRLKPDERPAKLLDFPAKAEIGRDYQYWWPLRRRSPQDVRYPRRSEGGSWWLAGNRFLKPMGGFIWSANTVTDPRGERRKQLGLEDGLLNNIVSAVGANKDRVFIGGYDSSGDELCAGFRSFNQRLTVYSHDEGRLLASVDSHALLRTSCGTDLTDSAV